MTLQSLLDRLSDRWAELLTIIIVLVVLVRAAQAVLAYLYIRSLPLDRDSAPELDRLIDRDRRVAMGGAIILGLCCYSLLSFGFPEIIPSIPRPWFTVAIGTVMLLVLQGPIDDARAFRTMRGAR